MAKGPKTQAAVDLLVSSGSFFFFGRRKNSVYSRAHMRIL